MPQRVIDDNDVYIYVILVLVQKHSQLSPNCFGDSPGLSHVESSTNASATKWHGTDLSLLLFVTPQIHLREKQLWSDPALHQEALASILLLYVTSLDSIFFRYHGVSWTHLRPFAGFSHANRAVLSAGSTATSGHHAPSTDVLILSSCQMLPAFWSPPCHELQWGEFSSPSVPATLCDWSQYLLSFNENHSLNFC